MNREHLFQLRIALQTPEEHEVALSIMTYIGCGLSSFGAFATIVVHLITG